MRASRQVERCSVELDGDRLRLRVEAGTGGQDGRRRLTLDGHPVLQDLAVREINHVAGALMLEGNVLGEESLGCTCHGNALFRRLRVGALT